MKAYSMISEEEIADAAFLTGLLGPGARLQIRPLPVKVDGVNTIAFCIEAEPVGYEHTRILHPVAIVPHREMLIQDIRNGVSRPLSRVRVLPLDVRHAKLQRAAMENPEAFFGQWEETVR
mgnify:CR=1 FL=1